jgi:putative salt-induced outer membrane protein
MSFKKLGAVCVLVWLVGHAVADEGVGPTLNQVDQETLIDEGVLWDGGVVSLGNNLNTANVPSTALNCGFGLIYNRALWQGRLRSLSGLDDGSVKPHSSWDGSSASLGANMNTGNSPSSTVNGGLGLIYNNAPWSNALNLAVLLGRASGITNKEKYTAVDQLNYSFSKEYKSFFFMNGDLTIDYFSPYSHIFVGSSGYGRSLYRSARFELSAQAGPGLRRNRLRATHDIDNHIIIVTQMNGVWHITDKGAFTEMIRYDMGAPFDYLQTITAFQNKIIGNLALQVSFELDEYSVIPPNTNYTSKTNTISSVSLVYNF